ncbi:DEAD/DEAH box helicase [Deinococcus maricopensis]|uniref:DEAD/DEAH box helicase domain protein n=1 Tax=Deinococcus maricopensis (strain DSM 21211 / LMG 22137 / NRRL B-23946 / LB-34) TaxID=709986 RepID=E8U4S7_DEIML|nr:DEAD/DEAH box helicase [Deinococcus maricopensis]ADV66066.1 DEAD/DEAH box helicase domain protein [Deinococcus maricopensis DSM 21211]
MTDPKRAPRAPRNTAETSHNARRGSRGPARTNANTSAAPAPTPMITATPDTWQTLLGDRTPTPVQAGAIPALLAGRDVITTARTGSGKTLAFLIPAAARGLGVRAVTGMRPEVLIITPTRELAVQIRDVARELGMSAGRITGGITPGQTRSEASGKGVITGTPGRLRDLILRRELNLADIRYIVLDEADELLSLGFLRDVSDILGAAQAQVGARHPQIAMASATFPAAIRKVAEQFMRDPERIDVAPSSATPERNAADADVLSGATGATHLLMNTTREEVMHIAAAKARAALREPGGCVVIFSRTKYLVKRRAEQLGRLLPDELVSPLEGNMDQKKRERTMDALREGRSRVLIATDIAGRGIDLPEVRLVIHMDVAATAEDHVHRSGRTARAGRPGTNLVLLIPEQRGLWQSVRRALPPALHPPLTPEERLIDRDIQEKQGRGSGRGHAPGGTADARPSGQNDGKRGGRSTQSGSGRAAQGGRDAGRAHTARDAGRPGTPSGTGTGGGRVGPQRARRGRR